MTPSFAPASLLLLALAATSCSSGPTIKRALTVNDADAVEVTFWSGKTGQKLVLRNKTAIVHAAEAKAEPRDARLAVRQLSGEEMQKLLDALATSDFFVLAGHPAGGASKTSLTVAVNSRQYVVTGLQQTTEDLQRWRDCIAIVTNVYNRTGEYEMKKLDSSERERLEAEIAEKVTPEDRARVRDDMRRGRDEPQVQPKSK